MPASILLVDDHVLIRKGLRTLLEKKSDFMVVGEASDGLEAYESVRELRPDVVVMDITMPKVDGIEASQTILNDFPDVRIVALSIHRGKRFVENMLRAGVVGYILKDNAPEELIDAIQTVLEGDQYLSPEITGLVVSQYMELLSHTQAATSTAELTPIEKDYILRVGEGYSPDEIAAHHALEPEALSTLQRQLIAKLGMSTTEELAEYAAAQEWFSGQEGIEQNLHKKFGKKNEKAEVSSAQVLLEPLTDREMDTLEYLPSRLYKKEIADELSVSLETVKTYTQNIYQKLGVSSRREAIAKAQQLGLIDND